MKNSADIVTDKGVQQTQICETVSWFLFSWGPARNLTIQIKQKKNTFDVILQEKLSVKLYLTSAFSVPSIFIIPEMRSCTGT
jgi:hypothetical protein